MSNQISNLLNDAQSTYRNQIAETKKYVSKWEATGLLEGIDADYEKHNVAILLENQARELVTENSKIGGQSSEEWNGVALPLVRRIFGEIFAKEFVSVQPMNLPSGLVFWLDFKYGTNKATHGSGADVMGDTSSSSTPTGGLYKTTGAGKSAYTLKPGTFTTASDLGGHSDDATITFDTSLLTDVDLDLAESFYLESSSGEIVTDSCTLSGTTLTFTFDQAVTGSQGLAADGFPMNVSGSTTGDLLLKYYKNTTNAYSRGDFEDTIGTGNSSTIDIGIPEMNVELRQEALVAKTRKLKVVWSPEFAQDLNAYHSIDAEAELTSMLSEYISMEIDLEILDMLDRAALHTGETFVLSGSAAGYVGTGQLSNMTARYDFGSWVQTLGYQMQKVSNQIHKSTMRGGANFAVVGPDVAAIIESIPGFAADTDGTATTFAAGVTKAGQFANRYTIYKNPYRTKADGILMGFRGNQFLETGAVYAPYIPLIMTPLVYDPTNFTPRKGVMTRYAKKVVRKEFYGKIAVTIH